MGPIFSLTAKKRRDFHCSNWQVPHTSSSDRMTKVTLAESSCWAAWQHCGSSQQELQCQGGYKNIFPKARALSSSASPSSRDLYSGCTNHQYHLDRAFRFVVRFLQEKELPWVHLMVTCCSLLWQRKISPETRARTPRTLPQGPPADPIHLGEQQEPCP